mgnify:CR=1 FL=1
MLKGKVKKGSKDEKRGKEKGMSEDQSVFHEIGKGDMKKAEDTEPYYMEETEKERE